jgi:hypothetical protein
LEHVRASIAICLLAVAVTQVRSQNQEQNLVDRLVRPDMSLGSSVQNKNFSVKPASIDSRGTVGIFYLQRKVEQPRFTGTRAISPQQYNARSSEPAAHAKFGLASRKVDTFETVSTLPASGIQNTADSEKRIATSDFPDQRPFREQGKSQKSLDRQNPPMTIDQVRDLLNKNK